jgi:hypothetical protein
MREKQTTRVKTRNKRKIKISGKDKNIAPSDENQSDTDDAEVNSQASSSSEYVMVINGRKV